MKTKPEDPMERFFADWKAADTQTTEPPALEELLKPACRTTAKRPWYWMAAAAVLLLVTALGLWWNQPEPSVAEVSELPEETLTISTWESPTDHLLEDL